MTKKVVVLPGDGIGPEVVSATVSAFSALTDEIELINADIGLDCFKRTGNYLPRCTLEAIEDCDAVLLGCVTEPDNDRTYRDPVLEIKRRLDLFANIKPVRKIVKDVGVTDLDIIIITESNEGLFSMSEREDLDGVTYERRVTYSGCKRICNFTKNFVEVCQNKKLTCVHRANINEMSDGLFLKTFYEVMAGSTVNLSDEKAGDIAGNIVLEPKNYEIILTLNLYGDVISEECAALVGGSHLIPSASVGDKHGLFEPLHKSNPDLVGLNSVNPTASLMSGAMLLDYIGLSKEASTLRDAVITAYKRGYRTADVGGTLGTLEFTDQVVKLCREPKY